MSKKLLIVEDEPLVAMDLKEEIELFGYEVVGVAQSADEALLSVEESQPDLALMDIHIVGSRDGIQTAQVLREAYQVPCVFLTSYCDDQTIGRAAKEMPYGYLTKPFQSRELKATLEVALHKAQEDTGLRKAFGRISSTVNGMQEALVTVSLAGDIQYINPAAERLLGSSWQRAAGRHLREIVDLRDARNRPVRMISRHGLSGPVEEFGLSLHQAGRAPVLVDLVISSFEDATGAPAGYVLTFRRAEERLRSQGLEETRGAADMFELASTAMLQLDSGGRVVRVNQALLRESGISADCLIGRTLTGLSLDPDPRIAGKLMHKLLQDSSGGGAAIQLPGV